MSDDNKPYNRRIPFRRIKSPSYDPDKSRVSGRGYDCGCRSPFHDYDPSVVEVLGIFLFNILGAIPTIAFQKLLATMPAWVPVEREGEPEAVWSTLPEAEKELEGVLTSSFQTWTDVPIKQWHLWYDWNFHLVPASGYMYLHGRGNSGKTMECEWDCGAFGDYDFDTPAGRRPSLSDPGPMFGRDWAWPMPGQNVWIVGRWIYDCGHASSEEKTGPNAGRMRSELHPCKAVATARWEGVKFDENERYVPAVQFMFFACRKGGYKDFATLAETDYEFIVDLPRHEGGVVEYPIGHSPDFALNTLVVRPRLLIKLEYQPFGNAFGRKVSPGDADPVVELLPPKRAGEHPCQARVRIPLTSLAGKGIDSYGVIVSMGWFDPNRAQAEKVKKVDILFTQIERYNIHEGFTGGEGEWQLKLGVNGRWHATSATEIARGTRLLRLGQRETIYLAENDELTITAHGMEEDAVGGIMRENGADRTLKDGNGTAYSWESDIDQRDSDHASNLARSMVGKMAKTLSDENDKLGVINPGSRFRPADTKNPITVQELMQLREPKHELRCQLTAREDGGSA